MRSGMQIGVALLLVLLFGAGAQAQSRAYGGRGEDMLMEMTEAGGGLFAVGTTASDDGDLSVRTRTGDAGWALLLDETGERRWSYASAHTGLARMIEPDALEDGRYSLVLTDEPAQRAEWLLLDDVGKALSRTVVSPDLIGDAQGYTVCQYLLAAKNPLKMAMILKGDRGMRAVMVDESGNAAYDVMFEAEGQGMAVSDGLGALAWVSAAQGKLNVLWLDEGGRHSLALSGAQTVSIADALMQADGSVICCGEAEADGAAQGFLARVSRAGELIFAHICPFIQQHLCQTETGFAAYGSGAGEAQVTFLDEDGGVLDTVSGVPTGALDIAAAPSGAALLTHTQGRRQPQAVITSVELQAAEPEEEPEVTEEAIQLQWQEKAQTANPFAVAQGYLVCGESDGFGVQVTCMDALGSALWSTRIPIHTAADALEWLCAAQVEDGGILLGGRYLTGSGEEAAQEGVVALLSSDGVLRRIETVAGAGAVCAMEIGQDGSVTLLAASDKGLEPDAKITYGL